MKKEIKEKKEKECLNCALNRQVGGGLCYKHKNEQLIEEIEKEREKWIGINLRVGSKEVLEALKALTQRIKKVGLNK